MKNRTVFFLLKQRLIQYYNTALYCILYFPWYCIALCVTLRSQEKLISHLTKQWSNKHAIKGGATEPCSHHKGHRRHDRASFHYWFFWCDDLSCPPTPGSSEFRMCKGPDEAGLLPSLSWPGLGQTLPQLLLQCHEGLPGQPSRPGPRVAKPDR